MTVNTAPNFFRMIFLNEGTYWLQSTSKFSLSLTAGFVRHKDTFDLFLKAHGLPNSKVINTPFYEDLIKTFVVLEVDSDTWNKVVLPIRLENGITTGIVVSSSPRRKEKEELKGAATATDTHAEGSGSLSSSATVAKPA